MLLKYKPACKQGTLNDNHSRFRDTRGASCLFPLFNGTLDLGWDAQTGGKGMAIMPTPFVPRDVPPATAQDNLESGCADALLESAVNTDSFANAPRHAVCSGQTLPQPHNSPNPRTGQHRHRHRTCHHSDTHRHLRHPAEPLMQVLPLAQTTPHAPQLPHRWTGRRTWCRTSSGRSRTRSRRRYRSRRYRTASAPPQTTPQPPQLLMSFVHIDTGPAATGRDRWHCSCCRWHRSSGCARYRRRCTSRNVR